MSTTTTTPAASQATDGTETVEVVVSAYAVPEAAWEPLRAVLGCLPGDLGRWKGGRHVLLDVPRLTARSSTTLADLTAWLRSQGIAHRVEVETHTVWTPGAPEPTSPVVVQVPLTVEQLDTLVDGLGDADAYRERDGGCGFCDHEALTTGDDDAECEDHASDRAAGNRYSALMVTLRDVRRRYL